MPPQRSRNSRSAESQAKASISQKTDVQARLVDLAAHVGVDKEGLAEIQRGVQGKEWLDHFDKIDIRDHDERKDKRERQERKEQRQDRLTVCAVIVGGIALTSIIWMCLYMASSSERDRIVELVATAAVSTAAGGAGGYGLGRIRRRADPVEDD